MKVIVVAGTCSGVGKSSIALGLMAACTRRGLQVQPFKIGPDFVDPLHHQAATGKESFNLDTWMMSREVNLAFFLRGTANADVVIVEGVMGLFDGLDGKCESGSTAEMAKLLSVPVLLVVDSRGLARSAAALVRGYTSFDDQLHFAGIIFNKIEVPAQKSWLVDSVSSTEDSIKVLGGIPWIEDLSERSAKHLTDASYIHACCDMVEQYVDLDALLEAASFWKPRSNVTSELEQLRSHISPYPCARQVRIGIARDAAFCLYYQGNLALLQDAGAELVTFSPLKDSLPTRLDAVYLGDGYPEVYLEQLSMNKPLLYGIRAFAEAGGIIYCEAGGLMFLSQGIENEEHNNVISMAGVFPFWTRVQRNKRRGYVKVFPQDNCVLFAPEIGEIRGQVHHPGEIFWQNNDDINLSPKGLLLKHETSELPEELEGYMHRNVIGTFAHLHFGSNPAVVHALMERCRMYTSKAAAVAAASASAVASAGPAAAAAAGQAAARAVTAALGESRELIPYNENASSRVKEAALTRHSRSLSASPVRKGADIAEVDDQEFDLPKRPLSRSRSEIWSMNRGSHQSDREVTEELRPAKDEERNWILRKGSEQEAAICSTPSSFRDGHPQQRVPQRIVSLLPLATEIIMKLGVGNRLLGITDKCDRPVGVRLGRHIVCRTQENARSQKGFSFKLDMPWLSKMKPDLIVTQAVCSSCTIDSKTVPETISTRNTATFVMDPYTVSDVWSSILELGHILGTYEEACFLVNSLKARLRKIAGSVSAQHQSTLLVLQSLEPPILFGRWIPELEMFAGAYDGLQKPGSNAEELLWQRITSYAPQVLVLAPCAASMEETLSQVQKLAKQPGFWSIPAVVSRQVYIFDGSFFSEHGLKLVEGAEMLAQVLHPSVLAGPPASGILKLSLKPGQKCRPDELHKHFKSPPW